MIMKRVIDFWDNKSIQLPPETALGWKNSTGPLIGAKSIVQKQRAMKFRVDAINL